MRALLALRVSAASDRHHRLRLIGRCLPIVCACTLLLAGRADGATYSIERGFDASNAQEIAVADDGTIWVSTGGSVVYRVTKGGRVRMFRLRDKRYPYMSSNGITLGPDGNIWIGLAEVPRDLHQAIMRVTPNGHRKLYYLHAKALGRLSFAPGPDGAIWFVGAKNAVGRLTPSGKVRYFKVRDGDKLTAITQGPDGAMWATGSWLHEHLTGDGFAIRITPSGRVKQFEFPSDASDITVGPDGNLWLGGSGVIQRLTTKGTVTQFPMQYPNYTGGNPNYPIDSPHRNAYSVTAGPFGDLLFTAGLPNPRYSSMDLASTGVVGTDGKVTETLFDYAEDLVLSGGMKVGPDGRVWMSNYIPGLIALAPDQPVHQRAAKPSIHTVRSSSGAVRTQLRCAGDPGKLCVGTLTMTSHGQRLYRRTYALAPFNRLNVHARVASWQAGQAATLTMTSKDPLTRRVRKVKRSLRLR